MLEHLRKTLAIFFNVFVRHCLRFPLKKNVFKDWCREHPFSARNAPKTLPTPLGNAMAARGGRSGRKAPRRWGQTSPVALLVTGFALPGEPPPPPLAPRRRALLRSPAVGARRGGARDASVIARAQTERSAAPGDALLSDGGKVARMFVIHIRLGSPTTP